MKKPSRIYASFLRSIKSRKGSVSLMSAAVLIVSGFFIFNAFALTGISLYSPNGDNDLSDLQEITWSADCEDVGTVNIYYSIDDFVTSSVKITENVDCYSGTYSWDTTKVDDGDNYKIRVIKTGDVYIYDTSDYLTIDNTAPVLTVPETQTFEATGPSTTPTLDPATATDNFDSNPIVTYDHHNFPVGTTSVTWTAIDEAGNIATAVSNVIIEDTTKPVFTLIGSNSVDIEYGFDYIDDGATASDLVDGDLTSSIVPVSTVNTLVLGEYTVTYTVIDNADNSSEIIRNVNVIQRSIAVTADDQTKIYGEGDPVLSYVYTPELVDGDAFTGVLVRDEGEDVGNYAISKGTLSLSDNYDLTFGGADLTITKADVTVSVTATSRKYNGNTAVIDKTLIVNGAVRNDVLTAYADSQNYSFVDKHVGDDKVVTVTGIELNGDNAKNYTYNTTATTNANITQFPINVTAVENSKTYDGDTSAAGIPALSTGFLATSNAIVFGGDTANFIETYSNKNVGTSKTLIPSGVVTDGNGGANYDVTFVSENIGEITQRQLLVTATGINKVYDAGASATVTLSDDRVPDDIFSLNYDSASFADDNVGNGIVVSVSDITISGTDAGNYIHNKTAQTSANITKRPITVTADDKSKVYGEDDPGLTYHITSGSLAGHEVFTGNLVRTGEQDVGNYAILQGNLELTYNYALIFIDGNFEITKADVTITADADDKVYDGDTQANVDLVVNGAVSNDALNATYTSATFEDRNAGNGKTVTATGIVLSGDYASNYTYNTTATTNANIYKLAITVTVVPDEKVYDGNTTSNGTPAISPDLVGGDVANFTQFFDNNNVDIDKGLVLAGYVNDGNGGHNYDVDDVSANDGIITLRQLIVTAIGDNKVYDATTHATVTLSDDRVLNDELTLDYSNASFEDANIGVNKVVDVAGIEVTGTDAGNYTHNTKATATADITAMPISVTAESKSKTYGDEDPDLTYIPEEIDGCVLTGELDRVPGVNVGTYAITQGTLVSGNNCSLNFVSGILTITEKVINVGVEAKSKTYGQADPALTYIYDPELVSGDVFTGALTRVVGENVGDYAIIQNGLDLSGNYNLIYTGANLTITPLAITVTAVTDTKIYDGNEDSSGIPTISLDLVYDDVVGFTQSFDNENVEVEKTLMPDGLVNDGNGGNNYAVTLVNDETGVITALTIEVKGDDQVKEFGDSDPRLTYSHIPELISGDVFTGDLNRDDGEDVGVYEITQGTLELSGNYSLDYTSGTFTIEDTTAPVIEAHDDVTREATGLNGAIVRYDVPNSTDDVDGDRPAICLPASGTTFAIGTTPVNCNITDDNGNSAIETTFNVIVEDTTVPVIEAHEDITAEATSPAGAVVNYTAPNSTDAVDGDRPANCLPASGSTFAIGTTEVECNITDSYGNVADQTTFPVIVRDTIDPVITNLTPPHTSVTSDATPEISADFEDSGSGIDASSAIISINDVDKTDYAIRNVDGIGYTPIIPLTAGTYSIVVSVDDLAGNSSTQSWSFIVNPAITTVTVLSNKSSLLADGTEEALITAQVLDNGVPVVGGVVNFTTVLGDISNITISDENGRATAVLTSVDAGNTTVTAFYSSENGPVQTATGNIELVELITDTGSPTVVQYPVDSSDNIAVSVQPYLDFSEAMNESTLTSTNVQLRNLANNSEVATTLNIFTNLDGSTRVEFVPNSDLDYDSSYYFFVGAGTKDLADNSLSSTWTASNKSSHEFTTIAERVAVSSYEIALSIGWNLISLPLILNNTSIADVLSDISDNIDIVKYYDNIANNWLSYIPGVGGALSTMEDGKGYWMFMNEANALTVEGSEVPSGAEVPVSYSVLGSTWNLIGFKSVVNMPVSEYITQIGDNDVLWGYKDGEYSSDIVEMEPGYGYWLYPYGSGYEIIPQ